MSGRMEFDVQFAQPQMQQEYRPSEDDPLRILVIGDFSGRTNRGVLEFGDALAQRPLLPVDVDNMEARLFGFNPQLQLPVGSTGEGTMTVSVGQLDDFHPDSLYEKLDLFRQLRRLRERLANPATFAEAAAELREVSGEVARPAASGAGAESSPTGTGPLPDASSAPDSSSEDAGSMFERLLGRAPSEQPQVRVGGQQVDIHKMLQRIVGPHIVPDADPSQEPLIASVDDAVSAQMRSLLHAPAMQSLEAAWRGLWWLLTNVETGDEIKIAMLDVSKEELAADLGGSADSLEKSGLHRALVTQGPGTPGGQAWSLVTGLYTFTGSAEDLTLLSALGQVAARAGGAFVGSAGSPLVGCPSLAGPLGDPGDWQPEPDAAARWEALRRAPHVRNIGLAWPRFLLRLPYGPNTEEIERFAFVELPEPHDHEGLLWGHASLALAQLLAAAFMENGWRMSAGDVLDVVDLPAFIYEQGGTRHLQACAEAYLSERAGRAVLQRGIMPLLSYQQRNAARLMRFQSIAEPAAGLAGPWS